MNEYNFILEASSFEKGLGNIKRWCTENSDKVFLRLYIPTFTLRELDFLRFKRKSFMARESLKFIENVEEKNPRESLEIAIEFPDIVDLVRWSEVIELAGPSHADYLNRIPRRYKTLLKSCVYKCRLDDMDSHKWILITEDPQVREIADICSVPWCSIVDADSTLSKDMNSNVFNQSERFNERIKASGTAEETQQGKRVVRTGFESTVYAPRGQGVLWTP